MILYRNCRLEVANPFLIGANLHFRGCHFTYWEAEIVFGVLYRKGGTPKKGVTLASREISWSFIHVLRPAALVAQPLDPPYRATRHRHTYRTYVFQVLQGIAPCPPKFALSQPEGGGWQRTSQLELPG